MRKRTIRISKPNDGNSYWETTVSHEDGFEDERTAMHTIGVRSNAKDPVHQSIVDFLKKCIAPRGRWNSGWNLDFPVVLHFNTCPIMIDKKKNRYYINGTGTSLDSACNALARLLFKSCFEDDATKLLPHFYTYFNLPEDVRYCIENRVPYFFYTDYEKQEVRLNVQQVGDKEVAIEVSDGLWGTMSFNELDKFCNFYLHGKKTTKWKFISPANLFTALIGREPKSSELKLMIEFLKQNRKEHIVEQRAEELVAELVEQYKNIKTHKVIDGKVTALLVRGKGYDWKLEANGASSGTQQVSTYVWQPLSETVTDEDGNSTKVMTAPKWRGPICIDNMAQGSSLGDQFAARAMALMNDTHTVKIVSTIKRYLLGNEDEYRVDWE